MSEKIMIVENDKYAAQTIETFLRQLDYEVNCFMTNGEGVLEEVEQYRPDLILMDIMLRNGDQEGIQLAKEIFEKFDIPLIFITASDDDQCFEKAKDAKPFGYVLKPFRYLELRAAVEMGLRNAQAEAELRKHKYSLEKLVAERTTELERVNLELQAEIIERRLAEKAAKLSEESTRAALKEKEILIKEIHQRVKGNLQAISSMLSLKMARFDEPKLREAFLQMKNRIRAMAQVHEKLYSYPDYALIEFDSLIARVTGELNDTYGTEDTIINIDAEKIQLPLNKAVPLSLILNELVSNALIHAFPDRGPGVIIVRFHRNEAKSCNLTVNDNGKGIPDEISFEDSPTLGLTLINALVSQIDGSIEVKRENGTTFTITFDIEEEIHQESR